MASVHYLTVQDMLWLNLQATGAVNPFDFMKLEEGTYYQYAYGGVSDLMAQAARFLTGFRRNAPFAEGNERTALLGALTFLSMNGYELGALGEAEQAALDGAGDEATAAAAMQAVARPKPEFHAELAPDVHAHAEAVLEALGWANFAAPGR